jgi:hypothetical protein
MGHAGAMPTAPSPKILDDLIVDQAKRYREQL